MSEFQIENKMMPRRKGGPKPFVSDFEGPVKLLRVEFPSGFVAAASFQLRAGKIACSGAPPCLMFMHRKGIESAYSECKDRGLKVWWA